MSAVIALYEVREEIERRITSAAPQGAVNYTRYAHMQWLRKDLGRAERAGIAAVVASDLDTALVQLALVGEQLHAQGRDGTVPATLTEYAVALYWTGPTALSASAEGRQA